ncbi:thioredoxin fold domain-containing protein [Acidithiobacillus ferrianus]|uniref:thioredoxin fold domain-containing protein n=1 Tax=Acidithiobacillus ferrianus TaxID=2678518 RepID=UPI0034E5B7A8
MRNAVLQVALGTMLFGLTASSICQAGIFGLLNEVESTVQNSGVNLPTPLANIDSVLTEIHGGEYSTIPGAANAPAACPPGYNCVRNNSPVYPPTENITAHLNQITYIQEGKGGPVIYEFVDPLCGYCHTMYNREVSMIAAGQLTVRYVPVAFVASQSKPIAADWLESSDPSKTLADYEVDAFGPNGNPQSFETAPTAQVLTELHTNKQIMQSLGLNGTPASVYQLKNGEYGHIYGTISSRDMEKLLPELAVPKIASVSETAPLMSDSSRTNGYP